MRDSSSGALAELIRRSDYWRRSLGSARGPLGHKEWMHFSVLSPDVDLLINFSLVDDRHRREVPSLVFLVRPRGGPWNGWIERPSLARVSGGGMALSTGESRTSRISAFDRYYRCGDMPSSESRRVDYSC